MPTADTRVRTDLVDEYLRVRSITEWLAEPLGAEDQTVQSMADVSPTKWHRAHVTWFFETFVLVPYAPGYRAYDADFDFARVAISLGRRRRFEFPLQPGAHESDAT